jgi:ABC-type Fe3+ transport system permease subunit
MNKKLFKNAVAFLMLLVLVAPGLVLAQNEYFSGTQGITLPGQGRNANAVETVVNIINVLLGLLGLLAVIIVLIGGFKWMTAQGSDDKVKEAQKTIKYGVIGLSIIMLAYVIVRVVINAIWSVGQNQTIQ